MHQDKDGEALEKGDPVSYQDGATRVKGVIHELRKVNGPNGWALVQTENDLQSIPCRDLKKEPKAELS